MSSRSQQAYDIADFVLGEESDRKPIDFIEEAGCDTDEALGVDLKKFAHLVT